jgi:hypothetical protein
MTLMFARVWRAVLASMILHRVSSIRGTMGHASSCKPLSAYPCIVMESLLTVSKLVSNLLRGLINPIRIK